MPEYIAQILVCIAVAWLVLFRFGGSRLLMNWSERIVWSFNYCSMLVLCWYVAFYDAHPFDLTSSVVGGAAGLLLISLIAIAIRAEEEEEQKKEKQKEEEEKATKGDTFEAERYLPDAGEEKPLSAAEQAAFEPTEAEWKNTVVTDLPADEESSGQSGFSKKEIATAAIFILAAATFVLLFYRPPGSSPASFILGAMIGAGVGFAARSIFRRQR
jgi:hypothetical protein